jgi:hypothetical protein
VVDGVDEASAGVSGRCCLVPKFKAISDAVQSVAVNVLREIKAYLYSRLTERRAS